jgi:hypothetical protein
MASKFAQFLTDNKIDPRRVVVASRSIERLRPEDRKIRLTRRAAKAGDAKADAEGTKQKPRSGRPVTARLLAAASAGKPVAAPAKTRLLRALNHVLSQRKKPAVELKAIF